LTEADMHCIFVVLYIVDGGNTTAIKYVELLIFWLSVKLAVSLNAD